MFQDTRHPSRLANGFGSVVVGSALVMVIALCAVPAGAFTPARAAAPVGVWVGSGNDAGEDVAVVISDRSQGRQWVTLVETNDSDCGGGTQILVGRAWMDGDELWIEGEAFCEATGALVVAEFQGRVLVQVDESDWSSPEYPEYGPFTRYCSGEPGDGTPTLVGTEGDDRLVGTSGNDVIDGRGGNDRLVGSGGADVLCGGGGRDVLRGGAGFDVMFGGGGRDVLNGGAGWDFGMGGSGSDELAGGSGVDLLLGDDGDDRIIGGPDEGDGADGGGGVDSCQAERVFNCEE